MRFPLPPVLGVALAWTLSVNGCGAADRQSSSIQEGADSSSFIADPSTALRPPAQAGTVLADARVCDHFIAAEVDPENATILARSRVAWRNTTDLPIRTLPFHLYMNGFRASDTTWMRESLGMHRHDSGDFHRLGFTDVKQVDMLGPPLVALPADLSTWQDSTDHPTEKGAGSRQALRFHEGADPSVMDVELAQAIEPGQVVVLELQWKTQLPSIFARSGAENDFLFAGQWFPKPGANLKQGPKAHVFHGHSEFFADFGNYQVELTLASDAKLVTNGILVNQRPAPSSENHPTLARTTYSYRADMVHDFVWTLYPDYVLSRKLVLDGHVVARAAFAAQYADQLDLQVDVLEKTLAAMERRFGPYPWTTITIVQPPEFAREASGMEYPTLITTSVTQPTIIPRWLFDAPTAGEMTTVHEFGHQYFQGMLASDEHESPWLDEGVNTFANALIFEDIYGKNAKAFAVLGHQMSNIEMLRVELMTFAEPLPINLRAHDYFELPSAFGMVAYVKTASALLTLRNLVGHEVFDQAMRRYVETFRFRHPTPDDLVATFRTALGEYPLVHCQTPQATCPPVTLDLNDFFASVLHEGGHLDFEVTTLRHESRLADFGWHRDDQGVLHLTPVPSDTRAGVQSTIALSRLGELRAPIEVEFVFEDQSRQRVLWDGQASAKTWVVEGKVVQVMADPDERLALERLRRNNVRIKTTDVAPTLPDDAATTSLGGLTRTIALVLQALGGP